MEAQGEAIVSLLKPKLLQLRVLKCGNDGEIVNKKRVENLSDWAEK